jgi:DNA-binding CsgD family transcriptional regulator
MASSGSGFSAMKKKMRAMTGPTRTLAIFLFLLAANSFAQSPQKRAYQPSVLEPDAAELQFLSEKNLSAEEKIFTLIEEAKTFDKSQQRPDAMRKVLMALMLESQVKAPHRSLVQLHIRFGDYLHVAGAIDLGVKHSKMALAQMMTLEEIPEQDIYNMIGKVASHHMQAGQLDSALVYYRMAISKARTITRPLWLAAAYNNMGMLQNELQHLDSAKVYFLKAQQALPVKTAADSSLLGSIRDNMAELAITQGRYADALTMYSDNATMYAALKQPDRRLQAEMGKARSHLYMKDNKRADAVLQWCEVYKRNLKQIQQGRTVAMHELWRQYYENTGNWQAVATHLYKLKHINDSIAEERAHFLNNVAQTLATSEVTRFTKVLELHKLQLERNQAALKEARKHAHRNTLISIAFALLGIIIVTLLFLFYRNKMKTNEAQLQLNRYKLELTETELRNRELEKVNLTRQLEHKKGDLSDLALYLSNLKDITRQMLERLNEAKGKKPEEQKELIKQFYNDLTAQLSSEKKNSLIQENVEQINKEFHANLSARFPELTRSEIELCGLLRLNLSNKEIAVMKNSSAETVKMARYRLRKKLGLNPEDDIHKFIIQI